MSFIRPINLPSGWREWEYIPTSFSALKEDGSKIKFSTSFGIVPQKALPASSFLIWSPINNCYLPVPWAGVTTDGFGQLAQTGTLIGAIGAINVVNIYNSVNNKSGIIYDIVSPDGPGPIVGFCLGNTFAQRTYTGVVIANTGQGSHAVTDIYEDILQRYRVSRFIFHHGLVENYYKSNDPEITDEYISLGINKISPTFSQTTTSITLYKKDGKTVNLNIKGFLPNGDAIINPVESSDQAPESGDFYISNKVFFLEDPYLMGGIWRGTEDERDLNEEDKSSLNLPTTLNQFLYSKCTILGGYALLDAETKTPLLSGAGQAMTDSVNEEGKGYVWGWWIKNENNTNSVCYLNDPVDRPSIEYTIDQSEIDKIAQITGSPVTGQKNAINADYYLRKTSIKPKCTQSDVLFNKTSAPEGSNSHIRIEIAEGGFIGKNNYHFPILQSEFVIQNNKYFKILAQIDSATLDVASKSVDGSAEFSLDEDLYIFNQYAWKITEHYGLSILFGSGSVENVSSANGKTNVSLSTNMLKMSRGTKGDAFQPRKKYDYLDPNSFYNRYTKTYKESSNVFDMYEKGFGWVLSLRNKNIEFPIFKLTEVIEIEDIPQTRIFKLELDGEFSDIQIGDVAGIFFGEPYKKFGSFNGGSNIQSTDNNLQSYGEYVCLQGNNTSPIVLSSLPSSTILGVLDSFAWGNGLSDYGRFTPMFFITTPEGLAALSSYYNDVILSEGVIFGDYVNRTICLRTGFLDFSEFPQKWEIAMGHFIASESATGTDSFALNNKYNRINSINLVLNDGSKADGFVTFGLGDSNDYYGIEVSGNGDLYLKALNDAELTVKANEIKSGNSIISPVYMYKNAFNSLSPQKLIYIGASTDKATLYIRGLMGAFTGSSSVKSCVINYVSNNQIIPASGGMDIFHLSDGEKILFYNKIIGYELLIGEELNNSKENKTEWSFSNSNIMVTGMHGSLWGTPNEKKTMNEKGIYSIPIMIANCCEYLCASYDSSGQKFHIFAKCYNNNGVPFIGYFSISSNSLSLGFKEDKTALMAFGKNKASSATANLVAPEHYQSVDMPFWFRPMRIGADIENKDKTYTATFNLLKSNIDMKSMQGDLFRRVYGLENTVSQVTGDNWGILSSRITSEGYIILFIETPQGLTFLFSNSGGNKWHKSKIILANNGTNGFMIDDTKFYYLIQGIGIVEKYMTSANFSEIINISLLSESAEGTYDKKIEELQKRIDKLEVVSLGTGVLNPQKFTGYVTVDGTRKIFFYDQNSYLSCIQSKKSRSWSIANNF